MASRELSLKSNEVKAQPALKRTPLSSPAKADGDSNLNENVPFKSSNVLEIEVETSSFPTAPVLVPLKPRSAQVLEGAKVSPPPTNAPFGPTILDKLITKNKLQSMKEAELRKDNVGPGEVTASSTQSVDPQILKKRKMLARMRCPFVTKRRKKFKRKQQGEATNQEGVRPQRNRLVNNANASIGKKKVAGNSKETKPDPRIAANRFKRRLNSDSSSSSQSKKTLGNKVGRPLKSQSKLSNVEALKQSTKLGRNNRYSTRSDSPVLRNGKRRKCDDLKDIFGLDKKKKRLINDLSSIKSDGMSDEQCSYVTASESDVCSFLDLETETNSQNLDVTDIKEESSDSLNFKLEVTSPSNYGDELNSQLEEFEEVFKRVKGVSSPSKIAVKEERKSVEEKPLLDAGADSIELKPKFTEVKNEEAKESNIPTEEKMSEDIDDSLLDAGSEVGNAESDLEDFFLNDPAETNLGNASAPLHSSAETILLEDSFEQEAPSSAPTDSSEKTTTAVPQGRKVRSASLNDSSKVVGKVSFSKSTPEKTDEEELKTSDSDEVSFTAENSEFEMFVEREYKRGRKKRSSSDTSLRRLRESGKEPVIKVKSICPIMEDEKSSDANEPFCDEKENEFYEKYITEESTSEEASCSSSQVSEHPKLSDKEFSALQDMECQNDKSDLKENEEIKSEAHVSSDMLSSLGEGADKVSTDTPETQAMKESILSALGLQSASMQADASKVKSKDKYTGTLKAVIKLDRKSSAGRMVFKQKDTSNAAGSKNLEYRICSGFAPGTENVPLTHLKDIAIPSIAKKALAKPKSHFDLSGPLNEVDLEVALVKKDGGAIDSTTDGTLQGQEESKTEPQKLLVIPEKSSSFSIHPERLCSDVCSYCHGKFGSLDTPCHIGQIKNSERRSKILSIEILLTKDSCLCDACFRYVDRRANCPSFKAQAPKPQKRHALSDAVCSVQGCGEQANHSVRRKWIVKLKKSIAKKLMIDMEKIQHNQHLPFPLCSQHYYWVDYFTVCGICKKRLSRNNMYALGPEAEELNQYLTEDGIPVHLTDKLFLCKLCRYYSSLRLKYKDLSLMTPGHKTYFRSYRRKILQYHDIEVSESEEDAGGKSADESAENLNQGKMKRRKSKKSSSEENKKAANSDEKLRQTLTSCSQGYNYVDLASDQKVVAPTIDYSALGETGEVGFNNIASLLSARDQPDSSGNQARIQVKFGNLNIGKLANLNIGQDARVAQPVQRPPYLPGEEELPLKADISFQSGNKNTAWERCTSTIQFDKDTKQLWQELQRPYGNASSFLRHLVMLEKHWRSGSLVLVEDADPRAVKYVNSVRNRVDSFEQNFKPPSQRSKTPSKSPSPAPRSDTPVPAACVPKATETKSSGAQESANKPSDSSDNISDKLGNKNDTPQVPPVSSAVSSEPIITVTVTSAGTSVNSTTTSLSISSVSSNSPLIQSLNSQPSSIPMVSVVNISGSNSGVSFSRSISTSASPNVSYASLNAPASSNPNVSYASLNTPAPVNSSPSVSLILPPHMSTTLPSSLQNTLINFTSNSLSLNQFSAAAPDISIRPNLSVKSISPNVTVVPKGNPIARQQILAPSSKANSGIISKLLTSNKSLISNPNSVSNNNMQFRKNVLNTVSPNDPAQFNKSVRKMNPAQAGQRQVSKMPPQLLRFSGPNMKPNVPPLELIVPKSFTMQKQTIPASTAQPGQQPGFSRQRSVPSATQGIMENLALLRQYRSLKPKPQETKTPPSASASFNPMICDVRSLATPETKSKLPAASASSMPKIPKALTITQVSHPTMLPRSVTVSLEKKPNQIPAAFLGGEKPSVSVFCEVNPPP